MAELERLITEYQTKVIDFDGESKDKCGKIIQMYHEEGLNHISDPVRKKLNELNWSEFNELNWFIQRFAENMEYEHSRRWRKVEQPKNIQNELNKIIN